MLPDTAFNSCPTFLPAEVDVQFVQESLGLFESWSRCWFCDLERAPWVISDSLYHVDWNGDADADGDYKLKKKKVKKLFACNIKFNLQYSNTLHIPKGPVIPHIHNFFYHADFSVFLPSYPLAPLLHTAIVFCWVKNLL